jgi:hypothetical protein
MLPALVHIHQQRKITDETVRKGPFVVVLTPYHPPKDEICSIIKPFCEDGNIKYLCIYDSEEDKVEDQIERLNKNGWLKIYF